MSDDSGEEPQSSSALGPVPSYNSKETTIPLSENDGSEAQPNSRKRKSSPGDGEALKNHSRPAQYLPAYHGLFNTTIQDFISPDTAEKVHYSWKEGRIGLSHWTAWEKEAFFTALDRKGRIDTKSISTVIYTKSEPEVRSFILALQDGYLEEHQRTDLNTLLDYSELPSAVEVSEACEQALESAADGLAKRQIAVEAAEERARYGEFWLLNAETILNFDAHSAPSKSATPLDSAMDLLNVSTMIDLSRGVFMNSKNADENWTSLAGDEFGPGLYATAFIDFYNLVIGITKRAVSSAIFLASSRHQAQHTAMGRRNQAAVKLRDVQAACEILGLKNDRKNYWTNVARRCKLDVYNKLVSSSTGSTPIHYDEVERILTADGELQHVRPSSPSCSEQSFVDLASISLAHDGQYLTDEEEDKRAEVLDGLQNHEEEKRLLKLLGQAQGDHVRIKYEYDADVLRPHRKRGEPLQNWPEKIRHIAEWQLLAGPPPDKCFVIKKRPQSRRSLRQDSSFGVETQSINALDRHPSDKDSVSSAATELDSMDASAHTSINNSHSSDKNMGQNINDNEELYSEPEHSSADDPGLEAESSSSW